METSEFKKLQSALLKEREEKLVLESEFSKQKAEFDAIFQNLADAYLMIGLNGKVLKMNGRAKQMLGYDVDKEDFNLMQIASPSDYAKISESFSTLVKDGVLTDFRAFMKTKDGTKKFASVNASIIYGENKKPVAAQGIVRDITESHKKQLELIKSQKRLETLILDKETAVLLEDENNTILSTNKKFCELFHIPVEPALLIGQNCSNAAEESKNLFVDSNRFVEDIKAITQNKQSVYGDELIMKNGTVLERDFVPIYIDDVYNGHLWTYRDVTLKKHFEKNIQAEKFKYESIINNTNLGLLEIEGFDMIKTINQRLLNMYNKTEEEVIGKRITDVFPGKKVVDLVNDINSRVNDEKSESFEFNFDTELYGRRYWLISAAPNYDINRKLTGYIVGHVDITDLKRLEFQKDDLLKKLGKSNDELQDYAHMVSHDLKAPLRNIDTLTSWFKDDYKDKIDAQGVKTLDTIRATIEKMEHLIRGILVYSSLNYDSVEFYNIDLNKLISEICETLNIPENTKIDVVGKLPTIKGDKYRLLQLFQNVIHNAVAYNDKLDALVTISCKDLDNYWEFCVEDNGKGIEPKYLKKIFEVFQKLDNSFESSGIGLSIVKKVVDAYDGEVYAESEIGKGTKIVFTIKKI